MRTSFAGEWVFDKSGGQSALAVTPRSMTASEDTAIEYPIIDPDNVPGNASLELKREVVRLWPFNQVNPDHFASSIGARLELVEISVVPKREDTQVMEARVVGEIDVLPGADSMPTHHRAMPY